MRALIVFWKHEPTTVHGVAEIPAGWSDLQTFETVCRMEGISEPQEFGYRNVPMFPIPDPLADPALNPESDR
jgi:hypothetical protein